MFAKWLEEYQKLSQKMRFLSQLTAFLISIIAILSLDSYWKLIYEYPSYLDYNLGKALLISVFQFGIGLTFAIRFTLLFSKSKEFFITTQILRLVGFALIISYWSYSINDDLKMQALGIYELKPGGLLEATQSLSVASWIYIFCSSLRQFITLIFALIKVRKHKV
ncbi:MAG: hypothetical protein M3Q99_17620 [Acidobacteriota bacterium]|nr:hypothetical protein [Acidobacteriota bacterium]